MKGLQDNCTQTDAEARVYASIERVLKATHLPVAKRSIWTTLTGLVVSTNKDTDELQISIRGTYPHRWYRLEIEKGDEGGVRIGLLVAPTDPYTGQTFFWMPSLENDYVSEAPPLDIWRITKVLRQSFGSHLENLLVK